MNDPKKRPGKTISLSEKQKRWGFVFVAPFLVGLVFFIIIPLVQAIVFSFSELKIMPDGFALTNVGLKNYNYIFFVSTEFRTNLLSSIGNMAINVPICTLFAFFMASLLNGKFHGRTLARMILFLPVITSSGIISQLLGGYTLQTLQNATTQSTASGMSVGIVSLLNQMSLNQSLVNFISSTVERISDIVAISAVPIVVFLAGLQSISPSIFEAAYVEGATGWDVFWKISLPMISPLILVCVVYSVIDSFTNISNPVIKSIHATSFEKIKFGTGSAMAISYMIIMGIILLIVYKLISKFIVYQEN